MRGKAVYAADTETTTNLEKPVEAYLTGFIDINEPDDKIQIQTSSQDMLDAMFTCPSGSIFFFHNLKFDYATLFPLLWENPAYHYRELITNKEKRVRRVIIKHLGLNKTIELRDSSPLFSPAVIPLREVLKGWCKNYTEKGHTEYYVDRPTKVSEEFLEYFKIDVCGLAEALRARLAIAPDCTKLTTSSQIKEVVKLFVNEANPQNKNYFDNVAYPALSQGVDRTLRSWYQGGYVFCNPDHANKLLRDVHVYDVNSMYPYQMYYSLLPYGVPKYFHGKPPPEARLFCQKIVVDWVELKEDRMPFLVNGTKSSYGSKEYIDYVDPASDLRLRTFYLTNMELEMFYENYNFGKIIFQGGFWFKASDQLFRPFIDEFYGLKQTNKGAVREFAKLGLNSPSGFWGKRPIQPEWVSVMEDKVQRFKPRILTAKEQRVQDNKKAFYLPTSIFITAYARMYLITHIQRIGIDRFVYCDTDSIHTIGNCDSAFDLDKTALGKWDNEENPELAKYLRQKRYAHYGYDKHGNLGYHYTVAGIGSQWIEKTIKSLDEFRLGLEVRVPRMFMQEGGMAMRTITSTV